MQIGEESQDQLLKKEVKSTKEINTCLELVQDIKIL